jgi:hypothetical protein
VVTLLLLAVPLLGNYKILTSTQYYFKTFKFSKTQLHSQTLPKVKATATVIARVLVPAERRRSQQPLPEEEVNR